MWYYRIMFEAERMQLREHVIGYNLWGWPWKTLVLIYNLIKIH